LFGLPAGSASAVVTINTGELVMTAGAGAGRATDAYVEGDLEMAANAQAAVSAAPDPRVWMPGAQGGFR